MDGRIGARTRTPFLLRRRRRCRCPRRRRRRINFRNLKYGDDQVLRAIASCLFNKENGRRAQNGSRFLAGYRLDGGLSLF